MRAAAMKARTTSRKKKTKTPVTARGASEKAKLNKRLAENEPLIKYVASCKRSRYLSREECESEAWRGATNAIRSYTPEHGAKLSTWICLKAKFAIEDAERRERIHARRESCRGAEFFTRRASPFGITEPDEGETHVVSPTERKCRLVASALDTLDERTREIIERVWYLCETQSEVAEALNISKSWCSRLYRRGMTKLRDKLQEEMTQS